MSSWLLSVFDALSSWCRGAFWLLSSSPSVVWSELLWPSYLVFVLLESLSRLVCSGVLPFLVVDSESVFGFGWAFASFVVVVVFMLVAESSDDSELLGCCLVSFRRAEVLVVKKVVKDSSSDESLSLVRCFVGLGMMVVSEVLL